ncbi:hypothetical protein ACF0H5_015535 [Mactra antiquata]
MATPSPTPSEDNRKNNGEIAMKNALDKVMTNPVQSYDEFLNSFTYLKQGMQEVKITTKKQPSNVTSILMGRSTLIQDKTEQPASSSIAKANSKLEDNTKKVSKLLPISDDIEEEILDDGDVSSRISQTKYIRTGSMVKFDNFVEDDDNCDLDITEGEGYMASFSTDNSRNRGDDGSDNIHQDNNDGIDNMAELCQSMSLDEKSTDKLLMNFLADLQNEMNVETNSDSRSISKDPTVNSNSAMDIENFLKRNKTQRLVETDTIGNDDSDDNNDNETDDDNDDDATDLLKDDSECNDVKVTINKLKLDNELKESIKENRQTRMKEIYKNALMDSEGNTCIRGYNDDDGKEKENDEDMFDVKNLVFPGQVEETSDEAVYENETLLDFKATYRDTDQTADVTSREDVCSDAIQPFKLDENFDYDNVVLTPKFSTDDLKLLKMNITPQSVVL